MNYVISMSMMLTLLLATGCANKPEPEPYEIINQKLKTVTTEEGDKLFSFMVAVKAGSQNIVTKKRQLTKSEMKKLFSQENFIDSSSLKLELEDKAADLLDAKLNEQNYCANSYKIEEVKWRDYSVRLSGRCNKTKS